MDDGFDVWYRAEHPRVVGACCALGGDADAAREATDEAFARALGRWDSVGAMERPGAWVTTVALNCLRRTLRRRGVERRSFGRRHPPTTDMALPHPEVWTAVRSLPKRQRTAVVLRYVADLPETQIAEVMGVTRGTVAASLAAARTRLADLLTDPTIQEVPHG
jgi:RNA polymerase sigma-70 factor (ECF subfamily)